MDDNLQNNPKKLMQLAKGGQKEAFDLLYRMYFTPVFRYVYFRVKSKEDAEDITQTVFLKVFKTILSFQDKDKSPLNYFFTVARNTVIDYWRKKKDILLDNPEDILWKAQDPESPQKMVLKKETANIVHKAIQNLTKEQQEVITLKFINEFSNGEIAKLLEKSEEAIRQLQCRGLRVIRKYFKDEKII